MLAVLIAVILSQSFYSFDYYEVRSVSFGFARHKLLIIEIPVVVGYLFDFLIVVIFLDRKSVV